MHISDKEWQKFYELSKKRARSLGARGELVEDMAATAIEKLLKQKTSPENIEAWLNQVVRNQMIDLGRKRDEQGKSRHVLQGSISEMLGKALGKKGKRKDKDLDKTAHDILGHLSVLIQKSHGSAIVSKIDNQEKIKKLLNKLSKKDQSLLIAHFFEDKSNKQIAKEMGYASDKVVATRIKQLLKKLQTVNTD
jgi:RNA polymerase sigma factor (sigma-70 family)